MLILAIETSGREGSVALLRDTVVADRLTIEGGRTAQDLAPSIGQLWQNLGVRPSDVRLIAVSTGPGSFTGLRVGITTAKTLAYALRCDVIGVDTLDAIAAQVPVGTAPTKGHLEVVVDAQRQELFVGSYARAPVPIPDGGSPWERRGVTELVSAAAWLSQLAPGTLVSGPGLKRHSEHVPGIVELVTSDLWQPTADAIGRLAFAAWQSGRRDDLLKLAPTYIRPSYAEDKVQVSKTIIQTPEP